MDVQIGEKIILLKTEQLQHTYVAAAHQLTAVERVDGEGAHLPVISDCRWKRDATLIVPLDELANQHRFMRIREQVVDGLTFLPDPPTTSGHYWFFGITGRHSKPSLRSIRVVNSSGDRNSVTQYWFGGDMQFSGDSFSMVGVWAPQWRPIMPGING